MNTLTSARGARLKKAIPNSVKREYAFNVGRINIIPFQTKQTNLTKLLFCMSNNIDVGYHQCPGFILMYKSFHCVGIHMENTTCLETGRNYNQI